MEDPLILLDCDGVLVESNADNLERLNEEFGTNYEFEQITSFSYDFMEDEEREFIYEECWGRGDLYEDAELSGHQQRVLRLMREIGEVAVVSSPMAGHIESKYRFLARYFDRERIVLASDKSILRGDVLIDDGPHNIEPFPGETIVYDRPWNRGVNGRRAYSFAGILVHVQELFPGEG